MCDPAPPPTEHAHHTVTGLLEETGIAAARGVTEVRLHPATFKRLVGYTGAKVTYTNGEPAQGMTLMMDTRSGPMLIATDSDCTIEDYVYLHEIPAAMLANAAP